MTYRPLVTRSQVVLPTRDLAVRIIARSRFGAEATVRLTDGTIVTSGHVLAAGYLHPRLGFKSLVVTAIEV